MKHTLPWNVTGIPPEAREIARNAAHREGATVGEWLTRRIMAEGARAAPQAMIPNGQMPVLHHPREEDPLRPRDELVARTPRPEMDSQTAFRRIDETFRNLAQRLENNERAQMEAQRAMSAAAHEINAATRDQAEAFSLLTTRIDRVERHTDTTLLRDAVRGLHLGLSRLVEQIAKTTIESSSGIASLASTVEMLAGKMANAREDSNTLSQAFDARLAALEERLQHNEQRLQETKQRVAAVSQLDETVVALELRVNESEERIQGALGRYLSGIEHSLEQIGERLERAEKSVEPDGAIEDALKSLAARVEAVEAAEIAVESPMPADVRDAPDPVLAISEIATSFTPLSEAPPLTEQGSASNPEDLHATELPPFTEGVILGPPRPFGTTENYLAQARRAARTAPEMGSARDMRYRMAIPGIPTARRHRRISHPVSMAFLALLVIGAGILVTRNIQRANMLALDSSNVIALQAPPPMNAAPSRTAEDSAAGAVIPDPAQPPAAPPPRSVASASVFNFGDIGTTAFAQLVAKANGGDTKAETALGLKYADGDGVTLNDSEAAYWLQKAADGGEAVAQYRLGTLYERGRGVATDTRQALRWYGEAAKHGNRRAMHNLAVVYADGTGTEKNFAEAARWFRAAADLGLTDSQFNLAVLYERGLGVKASLSEAYKWYAIAAEAGDTESKTRIMALGSQISPAAREAADSAAKMYKPRPIDIAANDG